MGLIDLFKPRKREPVSAQAGSLARVVRGSYDAARTTDGNRKHWANADGLSADAAANPQVRRQLSRRSRHEFNNNSYCKGIVETIANDTVSTGPALEMLTDREEDDEIVETLWSDWADEIGLADKLRVAREAKSHTGEVFLVASINPKLRSPIKLDVRVVEAERVTSPTYSSNADDPANADGIHFDDYGNPSSYDILKHHPGAMFAATPNDFDSIDAKYVYHYFKADRPGQRRGIPELTPALALFAILRRYTLATLGSAETAARHAIVMETSTQPTEGPDDVAAMKEYELDDQVMTALPMGWKLSQLKPEQPITNYPDFVDAILREIARCLNVPFTLAALDSGKSNLSAAYLDRESYAKARSIDRASINRILEWIWRTWFDMLSALPRFDGIAAGKQTHTWLWPSLTEHADPVKTANAQKTRLAAGLTDLATEHARSGRRYSKSLANQAKALGIPLAELQKRILDSLYPSASGTPAAAPASKGAEDDDQPDPEEETVNEPTAEST